MKKIIGIQDLKKTYTSLYIKKSKISFFNIHEKHSTLKKKLKTYRQFCDLEVISKKSHLSSLCVRHEYTDSHGQSQNRFALGLNFPQGIETHFLEQKGKKDSGLRNGEKILDIEIITGLCLFGVHKLGFNLANGKTVFLNSIEEENFSEKIDSIIVDNTFSLYEIDAYMGLSSFITQYCLHHKQVKTIHIEIPRVQYIIRGIHLYNKGQLSRSNFQKFIKEINKRSKRLEMSFEKRLPKNIIIKKVTSLDHVEDFIQACLDKNIVIDFSSFLAVLCQDQDWLESMRHNQLCDWTAVIYHSYVIGFLKLGKLKHEKLLLQIDDPVEQRILIEFQRLIKKMNQVAKYRIWGLYPTQKVFLNPEHFSNSDLFYTPTKISRKELKAISSIYNGSQEKISAVVSS